MFSTRLPARLDPNAFSAALAAARRDARPLIDLTSSNPTRVGLAYRDDVLAALCRPGMSIYEPEPFGLRSAREAVAADYARRGIAADPEGIVLTASTSEAYSLLFKLLCAPAGDSVLVPAPSYPLFEHLTQLDGVESRTYSLQYDGRWWVDFDSVDRVWGETTRAVLAVSPNNPTGSVLSETEWVELAGRCADRDAALIVDEVFADYPLGGSLRSSTPGSGLTFRLGGLSKSAGLPQMKLGWIAVDGPASLVHEALARLEVISDTYLSVSTPVQLAAPHLIAGGATVRAQLQERVAGNYARLLSLCAGYPAVTALHADAGWSAVLRVPSTASEEDIVMALLRDAGVIAYPGFFFDFPHEAFLIVSLLPEPSAFGEGMRRVLERVHG